jgi:endonuclease YncB( thermonuclease family)
MSILRKIWAGTALLGLAALVAWQSAPRAPAPPVSLPAHVCLDAATIRRVIDGDTVAVQIHLPRYHLHIDRVVRIAGIDAPEPQGITRDEGLAASKWARELLPVGSPVTISAQEDDSFGRLIASVSAHGYDVAELALASGHAVKWKEKP